ncbi:TrkH family potassium uptake protein [uncultured Megasphaera sp.]|uniref:TrkH family potassium uptake protein n=2 Tax=Megasphaera TaxID=906 RepID=UPI00259ADAF7|nr:TrkH family potassium uptake protein [uncultured Megasphaera sp.]
MNSRIVARVLGNVACTCAACLALPLLLALGFQDGGAAAFAAAVCVAAATGLALRLAGRRIEDSLTVREGIAITTFAWILITFLGLVPYVAGGHLSVLDGMVETISGLSGTGATVIDDVESLPPSLLLWRSMTHWFGGLGIIVIFIAIFPQFGRGAVHMFNAESTGPMAERIVPRIKEMAKELFAVYVLFTATAAAVFWLCGMTPLIAVDHAMSTIATGGFSPFNDSVAHFHSPVIEGAIAFFMIISSANFGMYVAAYHRGPSLIWRDTEFRAYVAIVAAATLLLALNLAAAGQAELLPALRQSFFQAASISSSTGFVSADFDTWPAFSKYILLLLMFVGGCAGSTAGGLKVTRLILLLKMTGILLRHVLRRRQVFSVRSNGEAYSDEVLYGIGRFFFVYFLLDVLWTVLLVCDGVPTFDAIGVSVSTMGSCGPAFGLFGATCTYSALHPFSKVVVAVSMLMGRLESFTVLVVLLPSFWRRRKGW